MKFIYGVVAAVVVHFLFAPVAFAGKSIAYSMNPDWQACSFKGIPDTQKLDQCITYPESGENFQTCENAPKVIYFVRHAEKRFRDINASNNNPEYILSIVGQKMAQHLAKIFDPLPVKVVYANHYTRTRQTACPLMKSKGIERPVVCKTETKSERFLLSALCKSHGGEVVVVVGNADTIPEILINLKVVKLVDSFKINLGEIYKVTFKDGKGTLHEPGIPYWNCDASDCHKGGALDVKLD